MAGLLDDVMDGIAAKEKQAQTTTPTTPAKPETPITPPAQTTAPPAGNPMNTYSDDFAKKYGDRKK